MDHRHLRRTILCMVLAFAMTFAPIFSSYSFISIALGSEETKAAEEQAAANEEGQPAAEGQQEESAKGTDEADDNAEAGETAGSETAETADQDAGKTTEPESAGNEQAAGDTSGLPADDAAKPKTEEPAEPETAAVPEETEAEEPANVRTTYTWENTKMKVTAVLADANAVPDDAELVVTMLDSETDGYNYSAYMEALKTQDANYTEDNTILYDVAIIKDGKEIEPEEGKVSVTFEFLDSQLAKEIGAAKAADVSVIHLPLNEDIRNKYDTTADAEDIKAEDIRVEEITAKDNDLKVSVRNEKVVFDTESFSVVALAAPLAAPLKAEGANSNADLTNFVVKADVSATKNDEGEYVIRPGTTYSIALTFSERMDFQFPNDGTEMFYKLPEGFIAAAGAQDTFVIKVNDQGTYYTIDGNTYQVVNDEDGNNVIKVNFNTQHKDFDKLAAAANLSFTLDFAGEFTGSKTEIKFSDKVEVDFQKDESSKLQATKKVTNENTYRQDGYIEYTIEVKSIGNNTNVTVTDSMDNYNGAIVLNATPIEIKSIKNGVTTDVMDYSVVPGALPGDNYSRLTINKPMEDGEVLRIKYRAVINPDRIEKNKGKVILTPENSITVKSDEVDRITPPSVKTTIDYSPSLTKTNGVLAEDGKTLNWTITFDSTNKVPMTDSVITDTIRAASRNYMKFSGTGVTVRVQDAEGNDVRPAEKIPWNELTSHDDYSWAYTIKDTEAYKYTFTYTTEVDRDRIYTTTELYNDVDVDGGGKKTGHRGIGPWTPDYELKVEKHPIKVDLNSDPKKISWDVTITVPKDGLEKAYVTDTYPHTKINGQNIYEPVDIDSIKVIGLKDKETWKAVDNPSSGKLTINFYYENDEGQIVHGLLPSGTGKQRTITVTMDTALNQKWLDESKANISIASHQNSIDVDGVGDRNSVVVLEPGVEKTVEQVGTRMTEKGIEVPIYRYVVSLSHVTSEENTLQDVYDATNMRTYDPDPESDAWYKKDAWHVYGMDIHEKKVDGGEFTHKEDTPGTLDFSTTTLPRDASSYDEFYAKYLFVYYLTVRDDMAEAINDNAIKTGSVILHNEVKWGEYTTNKDVEYEYDGVSKELLTSKDELSKSDEDIWAEFKIVANPLGKTLNNGDPIPLIDTAHNLRIDVDSIKINGQKTGHGVSIDYNEQTNVTTYTIPDNQRIEITYRAMVIYSKTGNKGQTIDVEFDNKVDMLTYKDDTFDVSHRKNTGVGVASIPAINLLKYEAGDITKKIKGAKFKLYKGDSKIPVKDKSQNELEFTTDEEGEIHIKGDMEQYGWALEENAVYYLREVEQPGGYYLANHDFEFRVSADGSADYIRHIYHTNDLINAKNYPVKKVEAEKLWTDGNDKHDGETVTVKLQQKIGTEGEWSDTIRIMNPDPESNREWMDYQVDDGVTLTLDSNNEWKGTFSIENNSDFPAIVPTGDNFDGEDAKAEYRIVETEVNGVSVDQIPVLGTVAIEGGYDANEGKYIYTAKNLHYQPIEVKFEAEKLFENGDLDEQEFTYSVYKINTKEDGTETRELLEVKGSTNSNSVDPAPKAIADAAKNAADAAQSDGSEPQAKQIRQQGDVYFSPITYTLEDLRIGETDKFATRKQFEYVIVEDVPDTADENGYDSENDIRYDKGEKRVLVTVTRTKDDDGYTILEAHVVYPDEGMQFKNTKEYTNLYLTKSIDQFIGEDTDEEYVNSTVVFRITYDDPVTGETGKTREVSVQFDKDNVAAQTVEIEKIPFARSVDNYKVEVKEIYSSNYAPGTTVEAVRDTDENGRSIWKVSIDNTKSRNETGSGVINKITKDGNNYKINDRQFKPGEEPQPAEGGDDEPVEPVVIEPEVR